MSSSAPDCCAHSNTPLLDVKQALNILLEGVTVNSTIEQISIADVRGRVLAQPVNSLINVPAFNNSAMDGYAIKINPVTPIPWRFKLTQRIAAGSIGSIVNEGEAARIFTGALVPAGANAVVMQEEVTVENDHIIINRQVQEDENIRPLGNDIKVNQCVLEQGKRLQAHHIALAASVGLASLSVFSRLKVGVFFTGDELVQPGQPLSAGKIYNSNQYTLIHLLQTLGCEVISLGQVEDTLPATIAALKELSNNCDLIMTTGGVSVGEEDHVKPAVEQLGQLDLWRIAMKPGKPLAFGTVGKIPFIGLPGNPVSAIVTYMLFARPTILKMMGVEKVTVEPQKIAIDFDWTRKKPRREYVRVKIDNSQIPPKAGLFSSQGSDVLSSIAWADGLVEIPEQKVFKTGDILEFLPFSELLT